MWLVSIMLASLVSCRSTRGDALSAGAEPCGGHLTGPVGIIHTPRFPAPFPVPLRCRWIVENTRTNGTISVYFTQQYTTSGLSFTEYLYYDETYVSYRAGERKVLTITDDNITRVKYVQVTSPFLVVELSVERLEGTQLRVLGQLNMYGFNITYEVRGSGPVLQERTCTAIECGLLGHCLANQDFTRFHCACFEGYSGADCRTGPLCRQSDLCKNGGTCRQMGPATQDCLCAPGYKGDYCEYLSAPPECGAAECATGCRGAACDCNPHDNDANSARFDTRMQIVDSSQENISSEILHQITVYLKNSNITLEEDVEVLNISTAEVTGSSESRASRTVHLRIWGLRREAGALRAALARLAATSAKLSRFQLLPSPLQFDMQPALALASVTVTPRAEMWAGSEFILSCMAYGSPSTTFTWHKDGVPVQFDRTQRDIWTRTVAEDGLGRRLAVLGVGAAAHPDAGTWSCAASDGGRQRCRALRVSVLRPPDIRLVPPTLTVDKGANASIVCLSGTNSRVHGALGFSWTREGSLLPLAPGREVWEDLYPAGSVLHLYNIQKSAEYRCSVSSAAGTATLGVQVWVAVEGERCPSASSHGLRWRPAAPGTVAKNDCPFGYRGRAERYCETKTHTHGVMWALPNFSDCLADSLSDIFDQFVRISYGYSVRDVSDVAQLYGGALRSLPALPGGGSRPLRHAAQLLHYLQAPVASPTARNDAARPLLGIFDSLLAHRDAFLDEQSIFELQNSVMGTAQLSDTTDVSLDQFAAQTLPLRDEGELTLWFPARNCSQEWTLASVSVNVAERRGERSANGSLVVVYYYNLTDNLPSLRRVTEFRSEGELEYSVVSQHTQLGAIDSSGQPNLVLAYRSIHNTTASGSKYACGVRTAAEPGAWNLRLCSIRNGSPGQLLCRCRGLGTFALLVLARSAPSDAESSSRSAVAASLICGSVLGVITALCQAPVLLQRSGGRLLTLLRTLFCVSQAAAFAALLECDQKGCSGWRGWLVAACWCTCGAALAGQPLLVQAELAGRAHVHCSSVALLAGVCIMSWLIARLSGGAPLRLGSHSQLVCAGASTLLALLTLALCVSALLRLRQVSNKIPSERRSFVRNRARLVRHIVVLVACGSCAQAAATMYVQPGDKHIAVAAVLAASTLATGVTMVVCYVVREPECTLQLRRLAALDVRAPDAQSDTGHTSLSLFIKHGHESESRGASVASPPQNTSANSYWRAASPQSPIRLDIS